MIEGQRALFDATWHGFSSDSKGRTDWVLIAMLVVVVDL